LWSVREGLCLSRLLQSLLLAAKSSAWLEKHIRHFYISYGIQVLIPEVCSFLKRCIVITRLTFWLDGHDNIGLAQAIKRLPYLESLKIKMYHFAFSSAHMMFRSLFVRTILPISAYFPGSTWTIKRLTLESFISLSHVAARFGNPDLFCCRLLQTGPLSLSVLPVHSGRD
jgi:hypothetical protein